MTTETDAKRDEVVRLYKQEAFATLRDTALRSISEESRLAAEVARLADALTKIDAIRNSIVGAQTFNWSEHAYPLVAILDAAGFKGLPYPEARKNVGTLIDTVARLERENEGLRKGFACIRQEVDEIAQMGSRRDSEAALEIIQNIDFILADPRASTEGGEGP